MREGAAVAGRYRLVEQIGAGGMGEVWRATDEILGRTVAVKVVLPDLHGDPEFGHRFLAEARAMASVHHPGIVAIHDFGETESDGAWPPGGGRAAFLVMEYVAGEPLSAQLRRVGRLSPATTMDLVSQTAQALQAVHEHGIVHRDIKPANLMVRPNGAIALTDFGIATRPNATALTKPGMVLGTPSYLAPEQVLGKPVSALSDVYALGVVAYECLAGQKPFVAEDPFAAALQRVHQAAPPLPADVPPHVASVVSQALATEPAQRWRTAAEFALAAGRAIAGTGPAHAPAPAAEPAPRPPAPGELPVHPVPPAARAGRRRWLPAVAAAVVVAVLAVGAAVLWGMGDRGSPSAASLGPAGSASAGSAGSASAGPAGTASAGSAGTASGGPAGSAQPGGAGASGGPAVPGASAGGAGRTPTTAATPGSKTTPPASSGATPYPRTRASNGQETVGVNLTPSYGSNNPMPDFRLVTNIIATAAQPWAYMSVDYHQSPNFQSPSGSVTLTLELHACSGEKVKDATSSENLDITNGTQLSMDVYSFHGSYYMLAKATSLDVGLTSEPSSLIVTWQAATTTATSACETLP